ncbi:MAG: flagellar export chaperone FliS [Holophagaceae bacterium]|nr:flagellar export chaperone FliS [Holophagaceae bacterium]
MTPGANPLDASAPAEVPAIPEHLVILLLEGGQRFLAKAEESIRHRESMARDHHVKKVLAILQELHRCLNHEGGGALAASLSRMYDWWMREIQEAAAQDDEHRLRVVSSQMGDIRKTWEHVLFRGEGMSEAPES